MAIRTPDFPGFPLNSWQLLQAERTRRSCGVVYIIFRSIGKYFGAGISARLTKCDENTSKYLGITLLPQAGVALGMAEKAMELGEDGTIVKSVTLFAVLLYEIIGPFLTKVALTKAGDIKPEGRTSARDDAMANQQQ